MTALLEKSFRVSLLEVIGTNLATRNLRSNREDRSHTAMRVKETIHQVQVPWATTPGARGQLSSQLGFGARSKCSCFFVADVDPVDLAVSAHSISNRIQAVANNAIDALNSGLHQGVH